MEREICNKVVIITGGAEGLGYHIADNFLANGAKQVLLLDKNDVLGPQAADTLNSKHGAGKATFIKCDVTKDLDSISAHIFKNFKVDILVNNAGICNEYDIKKTMEVNVISVLEWSFKFFEHIRKDKGGCGGTIFNVSSIYGFEYDPWIPVYKASKHAVIGFTKTLGHPSNYEKSGVRVIAICPGFTETSLIDTIKPLEFQSKAFEEFAPSIGFQSAEAVGKASVEIFKLANSSTSWVIKENAPIQEVKTH